MFSHFKSSATQSDFDRQDETMTPLHGRPQMQRIRRESQYRAVAHTMNKTVSGRYIRTWSTWFLLALAIYIAIYVGIAGQDLRKNLHLANSSLAKLNFLIVTFMVFTLPLTCRYFLNKLSCAIAGLLLGERGYSVPSAGLLLAVNLGSRLHLQQCALLFHNAEQGIKDIVLIRLIGDYITLMGIPFVSLALQIRLEDDKCWMGYNWAWLLFALLWPTIYSLVTIAYITRYWGSQECIRAGCPPGVTSTLQAALDLALILKDADGNADRLSGRWRYGHKIMQGEGYMGIDQSFLGLVQENECLSLTDMLLAIEREDSSYGGKVIQSV